MVVMRTRFLSRRSISESFQLRKLVITRSLNSSSSFRTRHRFRTFTSLDAYVSVLVDAVISCSSINYCRGLHCHVIKSLNYSHAFIGDQIVSLYMKLGFGNEAYKLFDEIPEKDLVSWNSLISGFSRTGDLINCLSSLSRMRIRENFGPNEVTLLPIISLCADLEAIGEGKCIHGFGLKSGMDMEVKVANALINLYGKCGDLNSARRLFEFMALHNSVTWNSVIAVHVHAGLAMKGMEYFVRMRRAGFSPDQATMVSLLQVCENLGMRKLCESIHVYIFRSGFDMDMVVGTALLNLYAKLGVLSGSSKVFLEMMDPDKVAWTAMLASFAMHGRGREAIEHFEEMVREGTMPDHVTFTHLLSACSHSGLVDEGKSYFNNMSRVYRVEPRMDHFSCMVDLMGRSGLLDEAYNFIKSMPMEPNSGVWGALIGACRVHDNVELGREVADHLIKLDPSDSRNYIILSNMYAAAGHWREASKTRALMKERNLVRNPGCSFIEHGNKIHRFVMGDHSHHDMERIYKKLEELISKIRETGFVSKTEFVLQDVDEEVKEDAINKHSEKLALAYGLLATSPGMPIIITKNLRICGDCHSTIKLASLIEKRTIIVRDTKRFHHFANGSCSCGDYW